MTAEDVCGTVAGYRQHLKAHEVTCAACRRAWREYNYATRAAADLAAREARLSDKRAYARAASRVVRAHYKEFLDCLAQERAAAGGSQ